MLVVSTCPLKSAPCFRQRRYVISTTDKCLDSVRLFHPPHSLTTIPPTPHTYSSHIRNTSYITTVSSTVGGRRERKGWRRCSRTSDSVSIVLLTVQASYEDNSFLLNGLSPISTRNLSFSCLIKMSPGCYQRMRGSVDKKWECGYRNVQQNIAFTFRDLILHFMMFGLFFITPNIFLLNKSFSFASLRWKKYSSQGVYKLP